MAELALPPLSFVIEADARETIDTLGDVQDELKSTAEAVEGVNQTEEKYHQDSNGRWRDSKGRFVKLGQEAGKAGDDIGDAAEKAGDAIEASAKRSTKAMTETINKISDVGKKMSTALTAPIIGLYGAAINTASDMTETLSKTEVVFGDAAKTMIKWSEDAVRSMGLAQGSALDMAALFGDMATGMGFTATEASEMSRELVQLGADLASFKNISINEVSTALKSIFTGETESLKNLGVVMTQTNLEAYALSQGITKSISAMTQAEQVALRYSYVMAMTANAQGDFVRTGDSFANQARKLKETVKQLGADMGTLLLPTATGVVTKLQEAVQWVTDLDDGTKQMILTVGGLVAAAGPLLIAGAKLVKLVTTLKTAMAALSITGPIGLGIGAAVVAIGALAAVAANATDEIDRTSAEYEAMRSKLMQPVKTQVETPELGEIDVPEVNITLTADDKAVLDKAQEIIDKLQTDEYKGVLVIDGDPDKAEAALAAVESAMNALISGDGTITQLQAAIKACEDLTISPNVDAATRNKALEDLAALQDALDKMREVSITYSVTEAQDSQAAEFEALAQRIDELGWEGKSYNAVGKFEIDKSTLDNVDEYQEALAAAAGATTDFEDAVTSLNNIAAKQRDQKIAQVNSQAAQEANDLAIMYQYGYIDREAYDAGIEAIVSGAKQATEAINAEYESAEKLNAVFSDGDLANDSGAFGDMILQTTEGMELSAERYQSAMAMLVEAKEAGEDMSRYQVEGLMTLGYLGEQAVDNYNALIAAQQKYEAAMSEASDKENDADALQTRAENLKMVADAFKYFYAESLNASPEQISATIKEWAEVAGESEEQIRELESLMTSALSDKNGFISADSFELAKAAVSGAITDTETEIERLQTEAVAAREAAATEFETALTNLQHSSELTAQELQTLMGLAAETGIQIEAETVNVVAATQSLIEQCASTLRDGDAETAAGVSEMIDGIAEATAKKAQSEGGDVGKNIAAGIASGLERGEGELYRKVRMIVNNTINEAKKTAKIESPSRRLRDEVGVMLMRGISVGVEQETPSLLKRVKNSVEGVVSGAAAVVNRGGYYAPAVSVIGGGDIDYDRMADVMTDAMQHVQFGFSVGDKQLAEATGRANARQLAFQAKQQNLGKGRTGK